MTVVAIDGPAGAGKSTVARGVARELGFTYLDSGAMYRAVALVALERGEAPAAVAPGLRIDLSDRVRVDGGDVSDAIRTAEVSEAASVAAAEPVVRDAMVAEQRRLLATGDWVAEGRDIGTVVAPQAEVKVFLTASAQARAQRRAAELGVDAATVLVEQTIRDQRDESREQSPLVAAADAETIDTTDLTLDEVVARIVALARRLAG
jgi:cytidylate kinase